MAKVIEAHELVCVDLKTNHNKFYHIELFDNNDVLGKWGRVGYGNSSQEKMYPGIGRHGMQRKMNEKYAKGYKEIETIATDSGMSGTVAKTVSSSSLQKIAQEQIVSKHPLTQKLIAYLTKVNAHNIYEASGGKISWNVDSGMLQTARGIITQNAIADARKKLNILGDLVKDKRWNDDKFIDCLEDFLTIVPQNIGMKRLEPKSFLPDLVAIRKQNDFLDDLSATFMSATSKVVSSNDDKKDNPRIFDVKVEILDNKTEWDRLVRFFNSTRNSQHVSYNYKIKNIYTIQITTVVDAFEKYGKAFGNIMELFHGSKGSNCLSILKSGLIIPPSSSPHVCGRLYGDGIYGALQSTKALNYATSYWSGRDEGQYFVFVIDMAMGKIYIPKTSGWGDGGGAYPKNGYDSTWAKGGVSGVANDECIVYKTSQVNLKYLLECEK